MSKAIFFNIPASGHIYPSLAMTRELVRRGERILYVATERFRGVIEAAGAEFRAYASLEDGYIDRPGLNGTDPQLAAELMIGTCRELLPELLALVEAERPDYLLHDSMCPWGALTARILGLPTVVSLALWKFTPAMLGPGPGAGDPEALRRGTAHAIRFHQISRQIAAEYGIRPLAYTELFNAPGDLTISYSSADIQPEGHRLDGTIHFVGSSLEARGDEPDFPLERLAGKQLIYASLGTVVNRNPGFFRNCIEAFADGPRTLVLGLGTRVSLEALGPLPANVFASNAVPQTELLRRSQLFITHCGMNSVHEAMHLGVPMLLAPQQAEQTLTGTRVAELGAGLLLQDTAPGTLRAAAETVLGNPDYAHRAALLGDGLRRAGGPARAADLVLAMVAAQAGVVPQGER